MYSLNIRKELFWDVDLTKFDGQRNKRLIIERTFNMGNLKELKEIFNYYGIEIIKNEIIKSGYLDNKTLNFASTWLNIPLKKFRCYIKNW